MRDAQQEARGAIELRRVEAEGKRDKALTARDVSAAGGEPGPAGRATSDFAP